MKTLSYDKALVKFRIRAKFIPTVKSHFKSNQDYSESLYACPEGCNKIDTSNHIKYCPVYADMREGLCLESDSDLVSYFQMLIEQQQKREEDE